VARIVRGDVAKDGHQLGGNFSILFPKQLVDLEESPHLFVVFDVE
jgi:hypothetical protein